MSTQDFCCNCKHLLGKRHSPEQAENWRCYHPANIAHKYTNLVTGAPITVLVCDSIVDARGTQDKCMGFELYIAPVYSPPVNVPTSAPVYSPTNSSSLNKLKAKLKNLSVDDL